ncbi:hypothetical protein [Delftia sp. PS-11]|uniref:hypothetical protein n=1 Tax=Delftia sp. PS-11 TaxID=2767222 RepID=UPI00245781D0|nr:hypothetical protein [Delftia sp. PS-11]KAJ8744131.1 hypothetical protein H9T68_14010 [Delftia sp. PS-11]
MNQIFDEFAWRAVCRQSMDRAIQGTGQSETLFAINFHGEISRQIKKISFLHQDVAIKIAREFGYLNKDELEGDARWNAENGYCSHGIEFNHCPVGCETDDECGC